MKVRLKRTTTSALMSVAACFNSMKVRLKRYAGDGNTAPLPLFQFHEGPIKTVSGQSPDIQRTSFNSMKVRLKRQ